jgi:hypothetical protein
LQCEICICVLNWGFKGKDKVAFLDSMKNAVDERSHFQNRRREWIAGRNSGGRAKRFRSGDEDAPELEESVNSVQRCSLEAKEVLGNLWPVAVFKRIVGADPKSLKLKTVTIVINNKAVTGILRETSFGAPIGVIELTKVHVDGIEHLKEADHSRNAIRPDQLSDVYDSLQKQYGAVSTKVGKTDGTSEAPVSLKVQPPTKKKSDDSDSDDFLSLHKSAMVSKVKSGDVDSDGEPKQKQIRNKGSTGGGARAGAGGGGNANASRSSSGGGGGVKKEADTLKELASAEQVKTEGKMIVRLIRNASSIQGVSARQIEACISRLSKRLEPSKLKFYQDASVDAQDSWSGPAGASMLVDLRGLKSTLDMFLPVVRSLTCKKGVEASATFLHSAVQNLEPSDQQALPQLVMDTVCDRHISVFTDAIFKSTPALHIDVSDALESFALCLADGEDLPRTNAGERVLGVALFHLRGTEFVGALQDKYIYKVIKTLLSKDLPVALDVARGSPPDFSLIVDVVNTVLSVKLLTPTTHDVLLSLAAFLNPYHHSTKDLLAFKVKETEDTARPLFRELTMMKGGQSILNFVATVLDQRLKDTKVNKDLETAFDMIQNTSTLMVAISKTDLKTKCTVLDHFKKLKVMVCTITRNCSAQFRSTNNPKVEAIFANLFSAIQVVQEYQARVFIDGLLNCFDTVAKFITKPGQESAALAINEAFAKFSLGSWSAPCASSGLAELFDDTDLIDAHNNLLTARAKSVTECKFGLLYLCSVGSGTAMFLVPPYVWFYCRCCYCCCCEVDDNLKTTLSNPGDPPPTPPNTKLQSIHLVGEGFRYPRSMPPHAELCLGLEAVSLLYFLRHTFKKQSFWGSRPHDTSIVGDEGGSKPFLGQLGSPHTWV